MIRILLLPVLTLFAGMAMITDSSPSEEKEPPYPEHLTGAYTGGFDEQTCHSCHFDAELNSGQGSLSVAGIGESISPGEVVEIKVTVEREDLGRAGFQMTARFEDGSRAGRFEIGENDRLMETSSTPDSQQYIQHSKEGSEPEGGRQTSWVIRWKAPEDVAGSVIFNIAANAANGDQSEFGDYIFTDQIKRPF